MKRYLFTSESVTEGHPDKLCDLISDAILDECLKQDKNARVAMETFASNNKINIAGQLTTNAIIDAEAIARKTMKDIGYKNEFIDFPDHKAFCALVATLVETRMSLLGANRSLSKLSGKEVFCPQSSLGDILLVTHDPPPTPNSEMFHVLKI